MAHRQQQRKQVRFRQMFKKLQVVHHLLVRGVDGTCRPAIASPGRQWPSGIRAGDGVPGGRLWGGRLGGGHGRHHPAHQKTHQRRPQPAGPYLLRCSRSRSRISSRSSRVIALHRLRFLISCSRRRRPGASAPHQRPHPQVPRTRGARRKLRGACCGPVLQIEPPGGAPGAVRGLDYDFKLRYENRRSGLSIQRRARPTCR